MIHKIWTINTGELPRDLPVDARVAVKTPSGGFYTGPAAHVTWANAGFATTYRVLNADLSNPDRKPLGEQPQWWIDAMTERCLAGDERVEDWSGKAWCRAYSAVEMDEPNPTSIYRLRPEPVQAEKPAGKWGEWTDWTETPGEARLCDFMCGAHRRFEVKRTKSGKLKIRYRVEQAERKLEGR